MQKIEGMERKYNQQFKIVFEVINQLIEEKKNPNSKRQIGFHENEH